MKIRRYEELRKLESFEDRFQYLRIHGDVGRETFGSERHLNQTLYRSHEWQVVRDHVIARDYGRDLGVLGYEIYEKILVHHMNPITIDQVLEGDAAIFDPEFLITTTHTTHNAIHYGREPESPRVMVERRPGDTKLW